MTRPDVLISTRGFRSIGRIPSARLAGLAIAAALAAASLVAPTAANAASTDEGLVAWYKLDESAGTAVADSSGNARNAVVEGAANWNAGAGFTFTGGNGSSGNSIKLPNNLVTGLDSITVSADVMVDPSLGGAVFFYNLGNLTTAATSQSGTGYLFSAAPNYLAKITNTGYGNEKTTAKNSEITRGVWKHLSYTQTGTVGTLYEDGVQVAQNTAVTYTPAQIGNGTTTRNYLGKSSYAADPSFKGKLRDFRVYNRALTATELGELSAQAASADVAAASGALSFSGSRELQSNLTVPTSINGVPISWSSSKPWALSASGKVIRPSENINADVDLTATISLRGASMTKTFAFTVLADPSALGKAEHDARDSLRDLGSVTSDLVLPEIGATFGSAIGWTSSNEQLISANGVVTRPAYGKPDAVVILPATAVNGSASAVFEHSVTVRAADRATDSTNVSTHTALVLGSSSIDYGATTTATATVTASDAGQVAGDVTFSVGDFLATRVLVDGVASVTIPSSLTLGSKTVTASYSGYSDLPGSTRDATLTISDLTAPVTTAVVAAKARTVTLTAADAVSGIGRIEYRIGQTGDWVTYTSPVVVGSAATIVQYRATDVATNVELTNELTVPDASESLIASTATIVAYTPSVSHGTAGSLTVRVAGAGAVPSGSVRVLSGSTVLGTGTLVDGRATVRIAPSAPVAAHALSVEYVGDADYSASSSTARYVVTKGASKASIAFSTRQIHSSKRAGVTATIAVPSQLKATGKVTITLVRSGKTVAVKTQVLPASGKVSVTMPKLKAGSYRVYAAYSGSSSFVKATTSKTFSVRK